MIKIKQQQRIVPALTALSFAVVASLVSQGVYASAFQLGRQNDVQGVGRYGAGGTAAPDDCAVVENNPAAMSDIKTGCVQSDIVVIDYGIKFEGSGTDALGNPISGGNGGDGGATVPIPAAHFVLPINEQLTFGAGFNAPFGLKTYYDDRWVGRYQAVSTNLKAPAATLALAYKIDDTLSIGASLIAQRLRAELISDINLGTILMQPTGGALLPQEADGQGGLKGADWGFGFGLGVLWKPTPADRIGFNFHSQIDHTINGKATFRVPSNLLPLFGGAFTDTTGTADVNTPWFASVGWWHTVDDRLSFGADFSYTHWSSFKELVIAYQNAAQAPFNRPTLFNYKNSWSASLGGDYKLDNQWTLRAGLGYDKTPTVDETRDPRVPDGSRKGVALGLGYKMSDTLRFDAGYYHLFVEDGKIDQINATFDHLVGKTKNDDNTFAISAQYRF